MLVDCHASFLISAASHHARSALRKVLGRRAVIHMRAHAQRPASHADTHRRTQRAQFVYQRNSFPPDAVSLPVLYASSGCEFLPVLSASSVCQFCLPESDSSCLSVHFCLPGLGPIVSQFWMRVLASSGRNVCQFRSFLPALLPFMAVLLASAVLDTLS